MTQYWCMKTFAQWADDFYDKSFIGIDQEGVGKDYRKCTDVEIKALLENSTLEDRYTDYKDRVFREFCVWMQVGDIVLIGTGPTTVFNLYAVVRVASDYFFDGAATPRHQRKIKFLSSPTSPRSMQRFARTSRLELIHETDFQEAVLSLIT